MWCRRGGFHIQMLPNSKYVDSTSHDSAIYRNTFPHLEKYTCARVDWVTWRESVYEHQIGHLGLRCRKYYERFPEDATIKSLTSS